MSNIYICTGLILSLAVLQIAVAKFQPVLPKVFCGFTFIQEELLVFKSVRELSFNSISKQFPL